MVLVAERLEGEPVSSRVSTFPDVFSVAKVSKAAERSSRQRHDIFCDPIARIGITASSAAAEREMCLILEILTF